MSETDGGNAGTDNGTQGAGNANGNAGAGDNAGTTPTTQTQPAGQPQSFDQAAVDRIVSERLARERAKFGDYEDLKNKATEFDKLQDAQKTELQREADRRTAAEAELAVFRVKEIRRDAAAKVGLPADLAEFITASDAAHAEEQAKRLAERIQPVAPPAAQFGQGVRPTAQHSANADDWIRGVASGR